MKVRQLATRQVAPRTHAWPEIGGWCALQPDGTLTLLAGNLVDVAAFRLPSDAVGEHGVSPDAAFAAISASGRVVLIDGTGRERWEFRHPTWGRGDSERGACWFSRDGSTVWAHVPRDDDPDEWVVLDASTGRLITRAPLQCFSAGSNVVRHPDGRHFGLSVGEGQDGSEAYWGSLDGGRLDVLRYPDRDRILVAASPDGRWFLTTPHSGGAVAIHRFPDGEVVASLEPESALEAQDRFDFFGGYVNRDTVVLTSIERDSLVAASSPSLEAWEEVEVPSSRAGSALLVAHGQCVSVGWTDGTLALWEVVPSA